MQVMILEEDPTLRTEVAAALAPEGFDILSFGRLGPAKEAARTTALDLLVLGDSVEGRLAHDVALLAEWRSPGLGAILLSDRRGDEVEELFQLIPSLQAVLGRRTGARTLAQVALSAAQSQATRPRPVMAPEEGHPVDLLADVPEAQAPTPEATLPMVELPAAEAAPGPADMPAPLPPVESAPPRSVASAQAAPSAIDGPALALPVLGPVSALPVPEPAASGDSTAPEPPLSPAETRRLLAELGRRYARLVESGAPGLAGRPVGRPSLSPPSAAVLPLRRPARASAEPDPTPVIRGPEAASPETRGRRLHLA